METRKKIDELSKNKNIRLNIVNILTNKYLNILFR